MALVLTRKHGEKITIGNDVVITVVSIRGSKVQLDIAAPKDMPIMRAELLRAGGGVADGRGVDIREGGGAQDASASSEKPG